jgi:GTPase SAR1 family protein
VFVDIIDVAGETDSNSISSLSQDAYIRQGHAFLLVFAMDSLRSLSDLHGIHERIQQIHDNITFPVPIILIGNKSDIPEAERKISRTEIENFILEWGITYTECSAKENKLNIIEKIFKSVVEKLLENQRLQLPHSPKKTVQKLKDNHSRFCQIL